MASLRPKTRTLSSPTPPPFTKTEANAAQIQILAQLVQNWRWTKTKIFTLLSENDFSDPLCRELFGVFKQIMDANLKINSSIITEFLQRSNKPEAKFAPLLQIIENAHALSGNVDYDLQALFENELTLAFEETYQHFLANTTSLDFDQAHKKFSALWNRLQQLQNKMTKTQMELSAELKTFKENLNTAQEPLLTGFSLFDAYNQGLAKGSLIVLGARPGVGKTAFALNLIAAVAHKAKGRLKRPLNVLLISLEMHRKEIMARLFAHLAQIPITNFSEQTWKNTAENKARMEFALNFINLNLNLLIAEQSLHEQSDIDAFVKFIPLINLKHPLDLVIVDHLQHLHYPNETLRTYEVGKAVDTFKQIAKENQIPIILLSQLNRESVQEQTLPTLKHLKDSASIEAAADQFILLSKSKHKLSNGNFVDICFFNMAKNRANALTDSYMVFNGETLTFKELKK